MKYVRDIVINFLIAGFVVTLVCTPIVWAVVITYTLTTAAQQKELHRERQEFVDFCKANNIHCVFGDKFNEIP